MVCKKFMSLKNLLKISIKKLGNLDPEIFLFSFSWIHKFIEALSWAATELDLH